jgi:hypothetical protein
MKHFYSLAAFMCALLFSSVLHAAVPDGTRLTAEEIRPIVSWVEHATGVRIRNLPTVTASHEMLKNSLGLEGVQRARSIAAYLPGRIIINSAVWDPGSLRAQSYIVHEMVHHAQTLSGRTFACHDAKEKEAYILQNRWLEEQGESPIYTDAFIARISDCRG